jgi:CelD/BcsL family acetyltransferase involved in cellulose biosynthesis
MGAPLTISTLDEGAALERIRGEWEQLLARSAGLHPSLSPTWLLTWWSVFGPRDGRRLRALSVRDGGELVGLFPLLSRRWWHHRLVPMKRIEPLGSGEDTADEIVSEYLGPIVASGREGEVIGAIADHLAAGRAAWDEMFFPALDGQSPAVKELEPALRARGLGCESRVSGQCPYVALPKRWEDYLSALPADDRYMVKRSLRDFERWAGKTGKVEVARTRDDLSRGTAILHRLHEHRWQAGGQSGVFASPLFRRFHDLVMPALLGRGELDLRWLLANGEPVAVSYGVIRENRLFYYQGGRATEVPKGVRPGIVLHAYAIQAAIEAGRLEYDFLAGDARYKRQLATGERPLLEIRVTRPSLPEAARRVVSAAVGRARAARALVRERVRPGSA